jgi:hypothetical protein
MNNNNNEDNNLSKLGNVATESKKTFVVFASSPNRSEGYFCWRYKIYFSNQSNTKSTNLFTTLKSDDIIIISSVNKFILELLFHLFFKIIKENNLTSEYYEIINNQSKEWGVQSCLLGCTAV